MNSAHRLLNHLQERLPDEGLFEGAEWRWAPGPVVFSSAVLKEMEFLGRVLLKFYQALNLLYLQSTQGKAPEWVAQWLDLGKPEEQIRWNQHPQWRWDVPRVIRPDLLWTDDGFAVSELDSVPGGIGLTGWLGETYSDWISTGGEVRPAAEIRFSWEKSSLEEGEATLKILGGREGMVEGFGSIFRQSGQVHLVVSEEAASYRPEMKWLADRLGIARFQVRTGSDLSYQPGDEVYRFFELFDVNQVPCARPVFEMGEKGDLKLTPPPKSFPEEKMAMALLWNGHLKGFWEKELGSRFFEILKKLVPYSWVLDPSPIPPHAGIPELGITEWSQLKTFSQKERDLILKISGYSESAWGARGVYLGSDLSAEEWGGAVDRAMREFRSHPYILQRFRKPASIPAHYLSVSDDQPISLNTRARICPYYFIQGEKEQARAHLKGALVTLVPDDKKIVHGMRDAILAPGGFWTPHASPARKT